MGALFRSAVTADSSDAAEQRLRELYGDVHVGGLGDYRERSIGDERFAMTEVVLEGDVALKADCRVVSVASSTPGYSWRAGRDEGELSAEPALFEPGRPMSGRVAGRTTVTTVTFDVGALTSLASAVYGTPTAVRFDGPRAASPAAARLWGDTVGLVTMARDWDDELLRAATYRMLAVTALEAFRLVGDREVRRTSTAAGLAAYRRACRFIDDHLSLPITEADIAQAAGVAEAELLTLFTGHSALAWTPTEQLRRGRLTAAHRDLVRADPTRGDRVATIAARWGFPSPARFARLHRSVYGVGPKWVLDR